MIQGNIGQILVNFGQAEIELFKGWVRSERTKAQFGAHVCFSAWKWWRERTETRVRARDYSLFNALYARAQAGGLL